MKPEVFYFGWPDDDRKAPTHFHVFNTVSLCWRKLTSVTAEGQRHLEGPPRCEGQTAVLIEDIIYMWGGIWNPNSYSNPPQSCYYNVLYAFDVDTHIWSKPLVSGTLPEGRCYHSSCVLGKVIYIHGGWSRILALHSNDIRKLDTATMLSLIHI